MIAYIKNKNVLFITTKRLDYIRNTQEIRLLKQYAENYRIIGSDKKTYFFRLIQVYRQLFFTSVRRFDAVLIGFAPQLILPFFRWKFWKKYRIIDFFISLYDTFCYDKRCVNPHGALGRLLYLLDACTIKHADAIICDTRQHGEYFAEEFHADRSKLHLLYLEADPSIYYPMQVDKPKAVKKKKVILFFGSMLPLQGYELVLDAFCLLKERPDYCFYFIGPLPASLKHQVQDIPNLFLRDWLMQEELARHIAFSDLCIAGHFAGDIEKAKRTIPGKAYIYRAMEKPMLLGDTPANHELFSADKNTVFVPSGSSKAISDAILRFFGDLPC
ncbi:MAG: glycosyltransferase [Clostridium sp.]|nr:glycosyltransferase [Lachnoclostridium sp.]MCM1251509.1 glycosyltransferase [Clostridium sp.]